MYSRLITSLFYTYFNRVLRPWQDADETVSLVDWASPGSYKHPLTVVKCIKLLCNPSHQVRDGHKVCKH